MHFGPLTIYGGQSYNIFKKMIIYLEVCTLRHVSLSYLYIHELWMSTYIFV